MDELKALEARVKALETDDDFGLQTKVAPPAAPAPAPSAASSAATEAVRARRPSPNVFVARRAVRRASRAEPLAARRPPSRPPPPQLKSENERLKKENETMAKLLAKERYRITHLIRTVESLTPA